MFSFYYHVRSSNLKNKLIKGLKKNAITRIPGVVPGIMQHYIDLMSRVKTRRVYKKIITSFISHGWRLIIRIKLNFRKNKKKNCKDKLNSLLFNI